MVDNIKLLFVDDGGTVVAPTFAEFFRQLGYPTRWSCCPPTNDDPKADPQWLPKLQADADWAEMIFVMNNEMQIRVNVFINPLFTVAPKKVFNLELSDLSVYSKAFDPELLILVDQKVSTVADIICTNIRQGYTYYQKIDDALRLTSLLTCFAKHSPDMGKFAEYLQKIITKVDHDLEYNRKEVKSWRDSARYDD